MGYIICDVFIVELFLQEHSIYMKGF